jgi:hypothetical protein
VSLFLPKPKFSPYGLLVVVLLLLHVSRVRAGVLVMTPMAVPASKSSSAPPPSLASKVGRIHLNADALMATAAAPSDIVDFIPLPGVSLQAARTEKSSTNQWVGSLVGYTAGDVTFVRSNDGTMAGTITTGNGTFYQLTIDPSGDGRVDEFEYAQMPPEDDPTDDDQTQSDADNNGVKASSATRGLDRSRRQDDGSVIKMLVGYSRRACCRIAFGNTSCNATSCAAATLAKIALAELETNQAYSASGIQTVVRVVHSTLVDYTESFQNRPLHRQHAHPAHHARGRPRRSPDRPRRRYQRLRHRVDVQQQQGSRLPGRQPGVRDRLLHLR